MKHWQTVLQNYLTPLLQSGLIEMTVPDKPNSPKQRYRWGETGRKIMGGL